MKFVPLRHKYLRAHKVNARHHFRDGMLHLNARVYFDEIEFLRIGVEQKFHRPRIAVSGRARKTYCRFAELFAQLRRQVRRRRHLDHFLMPPLDRAIAFPKVKCIAVLIGQNLHFEMPCVCHILFEKHGGIAKGRKRFVLRFFQPRRELRLLPHHAHPAPAPAHGRLND